MISKHIKKLLRQDPEYTVIDICISEYNRLTDNKDYVIIDELRDLDHRMLMNVYRYGKKNRKNKFHIKKITRLDTYNDIFYDIAKSDGGMRGTRNFISIEDRTGVYIVKFSNGQHAVICHWLTYSSVSSTMLIPSSCIDKFNKLVYKSKTNDQKPKTGVYNVTISRRNSSVIYSKFKKAVGKTFHHEIENIDNLISDFFNRKISRFKARNKRPSFKHLIYGGLGTGKTTGIMNIVFKYKDTHCVAFVDSLKTAFAHCKKCAKAKVPTIVIMEETDSFLDSIMGAGHELKADGDVKRLLDGDFSAYNPAGEYFLMLTNHTKQINIGNLRPGRMDGITYFNNISGSYLQECIKHYMTGHEYYKVEDNFATKLADKLKSVPGVDIMKLDQLCDDYTFSILSEKEEIINVKKALELRKKYLSKLKHLKTFQPGETPKALGYSKPTNH